VKGILRRRPSPALAISLIALFVSLGGVSYGVATGSIDSREIKNNSVTNRDVRNGSLLRRDFRRGQLPAGPAGPAGPRGPEGPAGAAGTNGFGTLAYPFVVQEIEDTGNDVAAAVCPEGTFPTGGDAFVTEDTDPEDPNAPLVQGVIEAQFIAFDQDFTPVGWAVDYNNTSGGPVDLFIDAACANADTVLAKAKRRGIARVR
jgi:hypothetical protein